MTIYKKGRTTRPILGRPERRKRALGGEPAMIASDTPYKVEYISHSRNTALCLTEPDNGEAPMYFWADAMIDINVMA